MGETIAVQMLQYNLKPNLRPEYFLWLMTRLHGQQQCRLVHSVWGRDHNKSGDCCILIVNKWNKWEQIEPVRNGRQQSSYHLTATMGLFPYLTSLLFFRLLLPLGFPVLVECWEMNEAEERRLSLMAIQLFWWLHMSVSETE